MILIVNDDGLSNNFLLLLDYCKLIDEVKFVIPSTDQSSVGNDFSQNKTFNVDSFDDGFIINGTPVDCVRFGLNKFEPNLIITGINIGFNIGIEALLKSGTFMGAREGYLNNIKSLACSYDMFKNLDFSLVKSVLDKVLGFNFKLANLNIVSDTVVDTTLCDSCWSYSFKDNSIITSNKEKFLEGTDGDIVFNQKKSSLTILK